MTKLYLAIPCYNEEEVLRDSAGKLLKKYYVMMAEGKITSDSKSVFIEGGSKKTLFFRESSSAATEVTRMLFCAVL